MRFLVIALSLIIAAQVSFAATIHVPADQPTIQAGIDAANERDTILVSPGIYVENLTLGKRLLLQSIIGYESTILRPLVSSEAILTIQGSVDSTCKIIGFTFENCMVYAIQSIESVPLISNNLFRNNLNHGAIFSGVGAIIRRNIFYRNSANLSVGGSAIKIANENAYTVIDRNLFISDIGPYTITVYGNSQIYNNTFDSCQGSVIYVGSIPTKIENNIISNAKSFQIYPIIYGAPGDMERTVIDYNDFWSNQGNVSPGPNGISQDPMYANPGTWDYTLLHNSPCIDAGDPDPEFNDPDGTRNDMGAIPYIHYPHPVNINFGSEHIYHVIEHTPTIYWTFFDTIGSQSGYIIEVGLDNDWITAEMWNTGQIFSADTSAIYSGLNLQNGVIYYLRMRIFNSTAWGGWFGFSFRMNTAPGMPAPSSPIADAMPGTVTPTLYIHNSADAEGDTITYYFEVYDDSLSGAPTASGTAEEQADSTGWTVNISLDDNKQYFWRARASDGYEYSAWSGFESFWVNSIEQYPTAFNLYFPPDTGWSPVYDFPVVFRWGTSDDPDPRDSVRYKLMIAVDSNFTFAADYDSIYQTAYPLPSLNYGTHYWWKVYAIDTKGNATQSNGVANFMTWVLGDANRDLSANVGDAVFLIGYIFKNGPAPYPLKTGDANGDCETNVGDVVYLINYIFRGGEPPRVGCTPEPVGVPKTQSDK